MALIFPCSYYCTSQQSLFLARPGFSSVVSDPASLTAESAMGVDSLGCGLGVVIPLIGVEVGVSAGVSFHGVEVPAPPATLIANACE